MLRIPARAEAQHIQVIGDTGAGKTTIVLQVLRQIRARGDSAIIHDPALEFTRRFYEPSRCDVILVISKLQTGTEVFPPSLVG